MNYENAIEIRGNSTGLLYEVTKADDKNESINIEYRDLSKLKGGNNVPPTSLIEFILECKDEIASCPKAGTIKYDTTFTMENLLTTYVLEAIYDNAETEKFTDELINALKNCDTLKNEIFKLTMEVEDKNRIKKISKEEFFDIENKALNLINESVNTYSNIKINEGDLVIKKSSEVRKPNTNDSYIEHSITENTDLVNEDEIIKDSEVTIEDISDETLEVITAEEPEEYKPETIPQAPSMENSYEENSTKEPAVDKPLTIDDYIAKFKENQAAKSTSNAYTNVTNDEFHL